jgi:hypothetical protein
VYVLSRPIVLEAAKDARFKGTGYHYFLSKAQQNLTQYLGLVGYWSMNYNIDEKIPDLSGNGNHGTLSPIYPCDCPTLVNSFDKKHGQATKYDGINDYVSISNSASLNITSSISMGSSIFPFHVTSNGYIICKNLSATSNLQYAILYNMGSKSVTVGFNGSLLTWSFPDSVPLDIWSHVMIVYNLIDIRIYVNSILSNTPHPYTLPISPTTHSINIGKRNFNNIFYAGLLDDISIWNKALSQQEVKKLSPI